MYSEKLLKLDILGSYLNFLMVLKSSDYLRLKIFQLEKNCQNSPTSIIEFCNSLYKFSLHMEIMTPDKLSISIPLYLNDFIQWFCLVNQKITNESKCFYIESLRNICLLSSNTNKLYISFVSFLLKNYVQIPF